MKVESFRKFRDKPVNSIMLTIDQLPYIYIDFESYPSEEFDTIGDMVATITVKDAKEEDIKKILQRLRRFNIPIDFL